MIKCKNNTYLLVVLSLPMAEHVLANGTVENDRHYLVYDVANFEVGDEQNPVIVNLKDQFTETSSQVIRNKQLFEPQSVKITNQFHEDLE